jgi:hypothetical protein
VRSSSHHTPSGQARHNPRLVLACQARATYDGLSPIASVIHKTKGGDSDAKVGLGKQKERPGTRFSRHGSSSLRLACLCREAAKKGHYYQEAPGIVW